jgi:hypothetical protein
MLNYAEYGIIDPIEKGVRRLAEARNPELDRYLHCDVFTEMSQKWRAGEIPATSEKDISDLKKIFFRMHSDIPEDVLDLTWIPTEERFLKNPAVAAYYARYCMLSTHYPRWVLAVPSAKAVVGPFGWGYNLNLEFCRTPVDDDHFWWCAHFPILVYLRERAKIEIALIERQYSQLENQKIIVVGAGMMPGFWALGYRFDPSNQGIFAYDLDKTIDVSFLKREIGTSLAEYRFGDMRETVFATSRFNGEADAVIMMGLLDYSSPEARRMILDAALMKLKPGGMLIFDLQVKHWSMTFADELFEWGRILPMYLHEKSVDVVEEVGTYVQHAGNECGVQLKSEYYLIEVKGDQLGVVCALTRR